MLTAKEIRQRYLDFFRRHGHEVVSSSPLIPQEDKTLLFTNAGMVQFKKLFLGAEKRSYARATTCQKCLRVSGKHNDLENVGRTARHHTFFEMLGNFSFGNYFKREAITWAWQFVTEELHLPAEKLWVTIYREDDEAAHIWQEVAKLPDARIVRMGEKDNFWLMGDTGPCGPCSEIYIDQGEDMACGPNCGIGQCDCDRFLEIWNLVFTQFDQNADGSRVALAAPNIDTGMGLERIAAVCQGKRSNFDCDLFQEIIQYAANLAGVTYQYSAPDTNDTDTALRVLADHSRAAAFLIAEGIIPSNEGRGYVLRRLLRRALRFSTLLGVHEPLLHHLACKVVDVMGDTYPELAESRAFIDRVILDEEQKFSLTLDNGLRLLDEELQRLQDTGERCVSGEFCFRLYDTHGFPLDIVTDVAEKRGFSVDATGFEQKMAEQRTRARSSQKNAGLLGQTEGKEEIFKRLAINAPACVFVGYDKLAVESNITMLLDASGLPVDDLPSGASGYVLTAATPFYGESGGQIGDTGTMQTTHGEAEVLTTIKPVPAFILHEVKIKQGSLHVQDSVNLTVDAEKRTACARNHSCTHLLHAALRKVLGTHVRQMGSLVSSERLRFDFSHTSALTPAELEAVEKIVNSAILADLPVCVREMSREEATATGAMALFDEKYGKRVRVVSIGQEGEQPESVELCGGTHLKTTGQAGLFFILSESGVASGTRRIEAVTGWNAWQMANQHREEIRKLSTVLKTVPADLVERVQTLQAEIKKLRKTLDTQPAESTHGQDLLAQTEKIGAIHVLCANVGQMPVKALRTLMDDLRSRISIPAVIFLAALNDNKLNLLLYVSKDLHTHLTANAIIKEVSAPVAGTGGGRADLAQAGGSNPAGLEQAFNTLKQLLIARG